MENYKPTIVVGPMLLLPVKSNLQVKHTLNKLITICQSMYKLLRREKTLTMDPTSFKSLRKKNH